MLDGALGRRPRLSFCPVQPRPLERLRALIRQCSQKLAIAVLEHSRLGEAQCHYADWLPVCVEWEERGRFMPCRLTLARELCGSCRGGRRLEVAFAHCAKDFGSREVAGDRHVSVHVSESLRVTDRGFQSELPLVGCQKSDEPAARPDSGGSFTDEHLGNRRRCHGSRQGRCNRLEAGDLPDHFLGSASGFLLRLEQCSDIDRKRRSPPEVLGELEIVRTEPPARLGVGEEDRPEHSLARRQRSDDQRPQGKLAQHAQVMSVLSNALQQSVRDLGNQLCLACRANTKQGARVLGVGRVETQDLAGELHFVRITMGYRDLGSRSGGVHRLDQTPIGHARQRQIGNSAERLAIVEIERQ